MNYWLVSINFSDNRCDGILKKGSNQLNFVDNFENAKENLSEMVFSDLGVAFRSRDDFKVL